MGELLVSGRVGERSHFLTIDPNFQGNIQAGKPTLTKSTFKWPFFQTRRVDKRIFTLRVFLSNRLWDDPKNTQKLLGWSLSRQLSDFFLFRSQRKAGKSGQFVREKGISVYYLYKSSIPTGIVVNT